MLDEFFNYTIYRLNDEVEPDVPVVHENQFNKNLIVVCHKFSTEEEAQKIKQILSSIKKPFDAYQVVHHDSNSDIISNAIQSKKVTDLMIFDTEINLGESFSTNTPFVIGNTNVFVTASIEEIIAEERDNQTTLRRALWQGLKSWIKD